MIIDPGGVQSLKSARSKLEAGADLVQIHSDFIYKGPRLVKELAKKLE